MRKYPWLSASLLVLVLSAQAWGQSVIQSPSAEVDLSSTDEHGVEIVTPPSWLQQFVDSCVQTWQIILQAPMQPGSDLTCPAGVRVSPSSYPEPRIGSSIFRSQSIQLKDAPKPKVKAFDPDWIDEYKDILVRVKETTTGSLKFGAGVSSNTGLMGHIVLAEREFNAVSTGDDESCSGCLQLLIENCCRALINVWQQRNCAVSAATDYFEQLPPPTTQNDEGGYGGYGNYGGESGVCRFPMSALGCCNQSNTECEVFLQARCAANLVSQIVNSCKSGVSDCCPNGACCPNGSCCQGASGLPTPCGAELPSAFATGGCSRGTAEKPGCCAHCGCKSCGKSSTPEADAAIDADLRDFAAAWRAVFANGGAGWSPDCDNNFFWRMHMAAAYEQARQMQPIAPMMPTGFAPPPPMYGMGHPMMPYPQPNYFGVSFPPPPMMPGQLPYPAVPCFGQHPAMAYPPMPSYVQMPHAPLPPPLPPPGDPFACPVPCHETARVCAQSDEASTCKIVAKNECVVLTMPNLEATCQRLTYIGNRERVLLEGDVKVVSKQNGEVTRIEAPRVVVDLIQGTFTVESGKGTNPPSATSPIGSVTPVGSPTQTRASVTPTTATTAPLSLFSTPLSIPPGYPENKIFAFSVGFFH